VFQGFVKQIPLQWEVDGELIAIGNTTWQTKNIASVRIESETGVLKGRKPLFGQAKPAPEILRCVLQFLILLPATLFAALAFVQVFHRRPLNESPTATALVWILGFTASVFLVWLLARRRLQKQMRAWEVSRDDVLHARKLWDELAAAPPEFHSLIFDASSGRSVALRTLDAAAAMELRKVILDAMRATGMERIKGSIRVVADDKGSASDLVEGYYQYRRAN
jgi:hypothetical protein